MLCLIFGGIMSAHGGDSADQGGCRPFVLDVLLGEPVPRETMFTDLASVRIVYLGEVHTVSRHHRMKVEIVEGLLGKDVQLGIGMEMFEEDDQPILDAWQTSTDSFDSLLESLGPHRWTNLADYRDVIMLARDKGMPLIGLNAPQQLVRKVARSGMDGLDAAEKQKIPSGTDVINPIFDRLVRLKLRVHKAFEGKALDRIVTAQALRDETMARAAHRFLESDAGKNRVLVLIAGSGHLNYGLGVPERVHRLKAYPSRIVLPTESGELVLSEAERSQAIPVETTHEDLRFIRSPIADYLHLLPLRPDDPESPAEPDKITMTPRE
jgi:uncharacterized iron-regulated protein